MLSLVEDGGPKPGYPPKVILCPLVAEKLAGIRSNIDFGFLDDPDQDSQRLVLIGKHGGGGGGAFVITNVSRIDPKVEDSEESESSLTEVSPETLASLDSYLPGGVNIIGV